MMSCLHLMLSTANLSWGVRALGLFFSVPVFVFLASEKEACVKLKSASANRENLQRAFCIFMPIVDNI